jgi:type IV pilus biogenesis protein CpaD/CtpE
MVCYDLCRKAQHSVTEPVTQSSSSSVKQQQQQQQMNVVIEPENTSAEELVDLLANIVSGNVNSVTHARSSNSINRQNPSTAAGQ